MLTRPVRRLLLGSSVFALAVLVAAADGPRSDEGSFLPRRQLKPLGGKVVGVLVGGATELMAAEGRKGPPDSLCLSVDGGSYHWLYVPVERKPLIGGLRVPVGTDGKTRVRFDKLSPASPRTTARFGITATYTLVEAEVNGGRGGPADEAFVATNLRPVEGTKDYPLRTAEVMARLDHAYQAWLHEQQDKVEKALTEAEAAVLTVRANGPRETRDLVYVTWMTDRAELHARFRREVRVGHFRDPAAAAPGQKPDLQFAAELGMAFEVSRQGTVERAHPLPVRAWRRDKVESFAPPAPPRAPSKFAVR